MVAQSSCMADVMEEGRNANQTPHLSTTRAVDHSICAPFGKDGVKGTAGQVHSTHAVKITIVGRAREGEV